jgi:hypothetical protein
MWCMHAGRPICQRVGRSGPPSPLSGAALLLRQAPLSPPEPGQQGLVEMHGMDSARQPVTVFLGHLRSYVGMGTARIACEGGCNCSEVQLDANHEHKTSQTFLTSLVVSAAPGGVPCLDECA